MRCKLLILFIVSTSTFSADTPATFGQCSRSLDRHSQPYGYDGETCASHRNSHRNSRHTDPLYPYAGSISHLNSARGYSSKGEPANPDFENLSNGNFGVEINYPLSGQDTNIRSFSNRAEAEEYVNRVGQHFWITYRDQNDQAAYQEVNNAAEISNVVSSISMAGGTVSNVVPVVARIISSEDNSSEDNSSEESGSEESGSEESGSGESGSGESGSIQLPAPLNQSTDSEKSSPLLELPAELPAELDQAETSEVDSVEVENQLAALEGLWTAVARSPDGELKKIELKFDSGGWVQLSIPDGTGQFTTVDRQAVIEAGQLKLKDGDAEMLLGTLAKVETDQFVVTRDDGQITFLRQ